MVLEPRDLPLHPPVTGGGNRPATGGGNLPATGGPLPLSQGSLNVPDAPPSTGGGHPPEIANPGGALPPIPDETGGVDYTAAPDVVFNPAWTGGTREFTPNIPDETRGVEYAAGPVQGGGLDKNLLMVLGVGLMMVLG